MEAESSLIPAKCASCSFETEVDPDTIHEIVWGTWTIPDVWICTQCMGELN
jgi:hypothetical protein